MLGIPTVWTSPENLREFSFALIGFSLESHEMFLTSLWLCGLQVFALDFVPRMKR